MTLESIKKINQLINPPTSSSSVSPGTEIRGLLQTARWPEELIVTVLEEDTLSRGLLDEILSKNLDINGLKKALRAFLADRQIRISNKDVGYISYPHSPMNQLCMKLAQAIKNDDETITSLLFPSLNQNIQYIGGEELPELTEDDANQLKPCDFILSDDGQKVVPILGWFTMQATNQQLQQSHYSSARGDRTLFPLSENELQTLQNSAYPVSLNYINLLKQREQIASTPNTLAGAVRSLCDGLMTGSSENAGNVDIAGKRADVARAQFMHVWESILTDEQREKISKLKGPNSTSPQAKPKETVTVTTRKQKKKMEFDATMDELWDEHMEDKAAAQDVSFDAAVTFGQFYDFLKQNECAGQLYRKFNEILNANFNQFDSIEINAEEATSRPAQEEIQHDYHLKKIEENLNTRNYFYNQYLVSKNLQEGIAALRLHYTPMPNVQACCNENADKMSPATQHKLILSNNSSSDDTKSTVTHTNTKSNRVSTHKKTKK